MLLVLRVDQLVHWGGIRDALGHFGCGWVIWVAGDSFTL